MSGYLLDTNVLSEIIKKRPEPRVVARLRAVPARELATSVVCVAELRYGAARHPLGARLWDRLAREVLSRVRILGIGEAEAIRAGDILADLERRGLPVGIEDILIAATALEAGLVVATRNTRHFLRIGGVRIESFWS